MKRLMIVFVFVAGMTGCATRNFHPTHNPLDPVYWRTETRYKLTEYYGMIPLGQWPEDIYYAEQSACERFRAAHPYTRPDEPCTPVHGTVHRDRMLPHADGNLGR